jgi:hypothetical protein
VFLDGAVPRWCCPRWCCPRWCCPRWCLQPDGGKAIRPPANDVGVWLSLVEHLVRDEGVAGSNPATPTRKLLKNRAFLSRDRNGPGEPGPLSGPIGAVLSPRRHSSPANCRRPTRGSIAPAVGSMSWISPGSSTTSPNCGTTDNSDRRPPAKRSALKADIDSAFAAFWRVYPERVGKQAAYKALVRTAARGHGPNPCRRGYGPAMTNWGCRGFWSCCCFPFPLGLPSAAGGG